MKQHPIVTETVRTRERNEMIDVTDRVQKLVTDRKIDDGFAIVFNPHTTAGRDDQRERGSGCEERPAKKARGAHPQARELLRTRRGNSDSHLKTAMVGNSTTVLIENGKLLLDRWQGIYFCEFDGPRQRELMIKLVDLGS